MEPSDATRLLAPGVEVTLKDGVSRRLLFDFEAICLVEDELGSLDEFAQRLQGGWKRKRAATIRAGMVAGLVHEGLTRAQVIKLLDFKQVEHYFKALDAAFLEALPEVKDGDSDPNADGESDSPGNGSTTTPPSALVAVTVSSGA